MAPISENTAAITGAGSFCAGGRSVQELWLSLTDSVVNCSPVPSRLFTTALDYPVFAAPADYLTPDLQELLAAADLSAPLDSVSRTIHLAMAAIAEAIRQAGLSLPALRSKRLGIALGTTVGCTFHDENYYSAWRNGDKPELGPVNYFMNCNIAEAVHRLLKTHGPAAVVTNACASGTDAIGMAKDWLEHDFCDIAIAGGADELSRVAYNGFASLMLLSNQPCRPFDVDRKGLNLGEGAGVLLMERLVDVRARKQTVQGFVRGYGAASDAYHPTAPHPEGKGLRAALAAALREAEVSAEQIVTLNCHGTGTRANDMAETNAMAAFFNPDETALASSKGVTGHTLGAAGGIEAVITLKSLQEGLCPGSAGCSQTDPAFAVAPLPQGTTRKLAGRCGISESLAFGGGNAALVLEGCS